MKCRALMTTAGGFSLINPALISAFKAEMPENEWVFFEAVNDVLCGRPLLRAAATLVALARFPGVILGSRIPPRDVMPRLPFFQRELTRALAPASGGCRFTFQTQSLFDASVRGMPHFLYTDHTFLSNRRYDPPRKTWPSSAAWRQMELALYGKCHVCFTTSRFAADSLVEDYGIDPQCVQVVGSGCNIDLPEGLPARDRDPRRIVFVGVEWARKGGPMLLDALRIVRKTFPDATLDVVGYGLGATDPGVRCHGRIPKKNVGQHLLDADIFCLPSFAEPSAGALVEASGFALPVVATRVGGTPERVREGETGILVEPGDVQALADALLKLMRDPALARRMGLAGRQLVLEEFTWAATARRIAARISDELKGIDIQQMTWPQKGSLLFLCILASFCG